LERRLAEESFSTGESSRVGRKNPIGVFYQKEYESTFEDRISDRIPFYRNRPPAKQKLCNEAGISTVDLSEFLEDLKTS